MGEGNRQAWKVLEDVYNAGKLKAVGVSNFQIEDLESLMETAKIKPMVNQVLCHISNTTLDAIDVPTTVSGRVTAELELAKPYLIITSENVAKEYLAYLDEQNISWIVCGSEQINLSIFC